MRVLVTGMGGHLGTRVAQFLEARPDVEAVAGFDFVPPRRRLQRATFKRIDPRDRDRLVEFVLDFAPTAVAHFGVYEPAARMSGAGRGAEHGGVHRERARRRGARRRARARRRAERHRGVRAGPGPPRDARRARAARADHAVRAHLPRRRGARGRRRAPPRHPGRRAAARAGVGFTRAEPDRPPVAAAGGAGPRVRRPAVPAPPHRRRRDRDARGGRARRRGRVQRRRPGRGEPVAGRPPRQPDPGAGRGSGVAGRPAPSPTSPARRSRRTCSSSCARAASPTAPAAVEELGLARPDPDPGGRRRPLRVGQRHVVPGRARSSGGTVREAESDERS